MVKVGCVARNPCQSSLGSRCPHETIKTVTFSGRYSRLYNHRRRLHRPSAVAIYSGIGFLWYSWTQDVREFVTRVEVYFRHQSPTKTALCRKRSLRPMQSERTLFEPLALALAGSMWQQVCRTARLCLIGGPGPEPRTLRLQSSQEPSEPEYIAEAIQ